jgi:hypothetical protein
MMYRCIDEVFARSVGVILSCSSNELDLIPRQSLYITQELEIEKQGSPKEKRKKGKTQMFDSKIDRSRV